jgi:hypothetical protein
VRKTRAKRWGEGLSANPPCPTARGQGKIKLTSSGAAAPPKSGEDNRERVKKEHAIKAALRGQLSHARRDLLELTKHQPAGPECLQTMQLHLVKLFARIENMHGQIDEALGGQAFLPNVGPTNPANVKRFNSYLEYYRKVDRLLFKAIEVWAITCGMKMDDDWVPMVIVNMQNPAAAKASAKSNCPANIVKQDEKGSIGKGTLGKRRSNAQRALLEVIEHRQMGPRGLQATRILLANVFARIERFQGQIDEAFAAQAFLTGAGGPTSPANLRRFNTYLEYHRTVGRLLFRTMEVWAFACSMKADDDWVPIVMVYLHQLAAKAQATAQRSPTTGKDGRDEREERTTTRAPRREMSAAQAYLLKAIHGKKIGPEGLQGTQLHLLNLLSRIERLKVQIDKAFGGRAFFPDVGPTNPANIKRFKTYLGCHRKVSRLLFKAIEGWAFTCSMKMDGDWTPIMLVQSAHRAALERSKTKRAS